VLDSLPCGAAVGWPTLTLKCAAGSSKRTQVPDLRRLKPRRRPAIVSSGARWLAHSVAMDVSTMRPMARQPLAMRRAVITLSGKHRKADDRVRGMELLFPSPRDDGERDATTAETAWMQERIP
jgi:hypothetical protein